jgi:hypothetical protein
VAGRAAGLGGWHDAPVVRGWVLALLAVELVPATAWGAEAFVSLGAVRGGCPSRAEVAAALEARLPGTTRAPRGPRPSMHYRLDLQEDGPAARLHLRDGAGTSRLERRLSMPAPAGRGPARAESCRALAEAAALMVARYLREIGYRSPTPVRAPDEPVAEKVADRASGLPPALAAARDVPVAAESPPAPQLVDAPSEAIASDAPASSQRPSAVAVNRMLAAAGAAPSAAATVETRVPESAGPSAILLVAGGAARVGMGGGAATGGRAPARNEVTLGLQGQRGWLAAELAGGVSTETVVAVPGTAPAADLRLRAFPLRAGLGVPLGWRSGVILPAVGVNLDLLTFRARGLQDARSGVRVEPAAEVGLGYRAGNRRWFVRGSLWGGLSLAPRDFDAGGEQPVYRTAAGYLRVAVEGAFALWKN